MPFHLNLSISSRTEHLSKKEKLTTPVFIRSIPTIVHKVAEPHVVHTGLGVQAVEMRVRWALCHWWGVWTILEGDVIQGRHPVKGTEAYLSQGNPEGLSDASQLNRGLVPLGSLVIQSPPYHSFVFDSFDLKEHICSPHRYAWVIMPEGDERDVCLQYAFYILIILHKNNYNPPPLFLPKLLIQSPSRSLLAWNIKHDRTWQIQVLVFYCDIREMLRQHWCDRQLKIEGRLKRSRTKHCQQIENSADGFGDVVVIRSHVGELYAWTLTRMSKCTRRLIVRTRVLEEWPLSRDCYCFSI